MTESEKRPQNEKITKFGKEWTIECPHCGIEIGILEINCGIFRCGFLGDQQPIPPHATEQQCREWKNNNHVLRGCAQPFEFNGEILRICDYTKARFE